MKPVSTDVELYDAIKKGLGSDEARVLIGFMNHRFEEVNLGFEEVDHRFEEVNRRMDQKFEEVNRKIDQKFEQAEAKTDLLAKELNLRFNELLLKLIQIETRLTESKTHIHWIYGLMASIVILMFGQYLKK